MTQKHVLQVAVAIGCLVPISAGGAGALFGPGMLGQGAVSAIDLDSHYRYLSGLLLAIGLGFLSTIPRIESQAPRIRLLAAIVVLGGFARLLGLLASGPPSAGMIFALGMELVVTPLLVVWQARVAAANRAG